MGARLAAACAVLALFCGGAAAQPGPTKPDIPPEVLALYKDYPVVELVTMGVGSLIWERHGHLALCVRYADHYEDACYNYGVGDFHDPLGMVWGFFRGTHSFWVDKEIPGRMLAIYKNADRSIYTQPLPLTQDQKKQIIAKLEHDILDENRFYAYDHFDDNCTTRIRDILDSATGGKLSAMKDDPGPKTFRDYARDGFFGMRLPLIATDLAMGRSTDRVPTYYERMFLPQYLREAATKAFGIQPIVLYQREGAPPLDDGPSGRGWLALIIVLATSPAWLTRLWGRLPRVGLGFAILPPVLLGLVFWTLAIISPLPYVRWNETCLIFFPLDLLLLVLPAVKRRAYARGRVASLGLIAVLLIIGVLKQPLWDVLLWPLIPALTVGFWRPEWTRSAKRK